jgi:hypothetical protein
MIFYRAGQFFVDEQLIDGSTVYNVCANSAQGDAMIELQHAETEQQAMAMCDALSNAVKFYNELANT